VQLTSKLTCAVALSILTASTAAAVPAVANVHAPAVEPTAGRLLVSGLSGTIGGAVGPDRALYVPEGVTGTITRVDPQTGQTSTFAEGLPPQVIPLGGVIDVAFVGKTAYALVTLVSADVGGDSVDGIYRIDGPHHATVIADLGAWSIAHPPRTPFDVPSGLQFALEPVGGGFLVSDGHHNRVLRVTKKGDISELIGFDNVVPTGLAVTGNRVFLSQTGPVPHTPDTGKVVVFNKHGGPAHDVASGYSVMVDVELGKNHALYALSQGDSPGDVPPASPAKPDSGKLLRVNDDGTFTVVVDKLNRPTSVHFIGNAALVVTLNGEVWRIDDVVGHH
jgi:hypothetical protein